VCAVPVKSRNRNVKPNRKMVASVILIFLSIVYELVFDFGTMKMLAS